MEIDAKDITTIAFRIVELADDILEVSAGLNGCGDAIACNVCSKKLISAASALKSAAKKL